VVLCALLVGAAWGLVEWAARWLFARRRALGICCTVVAALWVMWLHAQNGRYVLTLLSTHDKTLHDDYSSDDYNTVCTAVLDTRTGTVYQLGALSNRKWIEYQPQTGAFEIQRGSQKPK
jgi:hypothetical protein